MKKKDRTKAAIESRNFRRKWVSQCYAISYVENKSEAFLEGERLPIDERDLRLADSMPLKGLAVEVTLGHYYFDNTPLIGKVVDFNMWGRRLTGEEARSYSDCRRYVPRVGDLVNSTTEFDTTGSLIRKIKVDLADTLCHHENSVNHLYVHTPFRRQVDAKEACDKYLMNSMAGPFEDIDNDWRLFHQMASNNSAVRSLCWAGGRVLFWQSYKHHKDPEVKGYNFVYGSTGKQLQISPWRRNAPNNDISQDICTVSYHNTLPYNACWIDTDCERSQQWSACSGCWLPHTIFKGVTIHLRGLCEKSIFDTKYQVGCSDG